MEANLRLWPQLASILRTTPKGRIRCDVRLVGPVGDDTVLHPCVSGSQRCPRPPSLTKTKPSRRSRAAIRLPSTRSLLLHIRALMAHAPAQRIEHEGRRVEMRLCLTLSELVQVAADAFSHATAPVDNGSF